MRELSGYDEAAGKYYESLSMATMPLLSWNFHVENYNEMISFREDLMMLKEMSKNWDLEINFQKELTLEKMVVVVTTPKLEIVYATHNIQKMNGYSPNEVLGQSPKMFQGKDTCLAISKKIRFAVENKIAFEEVVVNYKKDKTVYNCKIKGMPVFDNQGVLINYIAFEQVAA